MGIPIIIHRSISGVPIAKLFVGGVGLGLLMDPLQMATSYFVSKKRGYHASSSRELLDTSGAIWALLLSVFLFVTISFGILTPTESSAIAVVYSFLVCMFIYKELGFKENTRLSLKRLL